MAQPCLIHIPIKAEPQHRLALGREKLEARHPWRKRVVVELDKMMSEEEWSELESI